MIQGPGEFFILGKSSLTPSGLGWKERRFFSVLLLFFFLIKVLKKNTDQRKDTEMQKWIQCTPEKGQSSGTPLPHQFVWENVYTF